MEVNSQFQTITDAGSLIQEEDLQKILKRKKKLLLNSGRINRLIIPQQGFEHRT